MLRATVTERDFVWLVGSLARLHRLPFDARLLLQQFPPPYGIQRLNEAARAIGLRVGEAMGFSDLRRIPYPSFAFFKPSPSANEDYHRPAILLSSDGDRLLYFSSDSEAPKTARAEEVPVSFASACFFVAREDASDTAADNDESAALPARFGFNWFAHELLRHKKVWRDVLAASLFIQLIGLLTPLATQVVLDKVIVHQTTNTLMVVVVALAVFLLFNAAMSWLRQYLVLHTGNRVDAALGSQVLKHLLRLPMPYFEHRPTGTLVARLQAVETIREFMAGAAVALALDAPFLLVFLAVMFFYSWQLTLIALSVLLVIATLSALVTPALRARLNRQFLLGAKNQAFVTEHLAGMETVKSLQMEPRLEDRYDDMLARYLAAGFSTRTLSNTYNVAANGLEQAMTLGILAVGALMVMKNDGFTIGMLVAFQMFASRLSQPMLRLAGLWQEFQQASIAVKRLGDIMDVPPEARVAAPQRSAAGLGGIEIRNLGFRYSADRPWLYRGLNLSLKPGKLTLLTGPSGSGKSTLTRILLGFYAPEEGSVLLDGRDIRHLAPNELRGYFGVVPQETFLFSGTVLENLTVASPTASFEDVQQACRAAGIHEVVEALPQGYSTVVGEHGVGLSGGQKQRIAIARAILRRPRVLIFDESTSSLDGKTAELLAASIRSLKGRATMLFVAHNAPGGLDPDVRVDLISAAADAGGRG